MCDNTAKTLRSNHLKHNDRRIQGTDASVCNVERPVARELAPA
jgi:hypothetical protein